MSDQVLERTPAPQPAASGSAAGNRPRSLLRAPWLLIGLGLLTVSTAIVLWARTRPGFDPYGWLVWGRQTVSWSLNTNAAPSWKPLPYLFTAPFGLAGHYQLWLWMIASVAVSLSGVVFAARIAYRVVGVQDGDRRAALVAALFAGAALLGIQDYWHYILSAQSDPMIVALVLAAIDMHLSGHPRLAFACGVLASLGRPEAWPFLALYTIWAWRALPQTRRLLIIGIALLLALWFGIPALTSRTPFVAASNALGSGRALHNDKVFGTIERFFDLHYPPLELAALGSVALAVWRRDRLTLGLAAGVVAWVVLEIAFALHGWPGLGRYMFEAAAVMVVIAGVGIGRVLAEGFRISRTAGLGAIALAALVIGTLLPSAISDARAEHADIKVQRARTTEIDKLAGTISRLGGATLLRTCGEPLTRLEYQTVLAWELGDNVASVGYKYSQAIAHGNPVILFSPQSPSGWVVQALHQVTPACRRLPHYALNP